MIPAVALAVAVTLSPAAVMDDAATPPSHKQAAFADCVAHRESRGNPTAQSRISSSAGKYQFLQNSWGRSLPYMVADRLRQFGMPAKQARALRVTLQRTPIHKWEERVQDVAFFAVLNAEGPWTGWRHWHLAGSRCNRLVPAGAR